MNLIRIGLAAAMIASLGACVTPVGPVEVTRFHGPDISALGKGTISVEPAPGADGNGLEWQAYKAAVMRQLIGLGYTEASPGVGAQVATMILSRRTIEPAGSSPVSVGLGGSAGTHGGGLGLGIGLNLSPKPGQQIATDLAVRIRDRTAGTVLWEGRASFVVSAKSPLAATALGAPKMSEALFQGFPGRSGETIEVK
ncbi:MAG: DUF4136 domain-containing protein [Novosphingobium sp.]|uniref:DUF4136 domain-containing protein n=1 Tax=Novosphingobium sp. TaxID=1874826 RepID=UPI0032BF0756